LSENSMKEADLDLLLNETGYIELDKKNID
jgi:hypothetical protein